MRDVDRELALQGIGPGNVDKEAYKTRIISPREGYLDRFEFIPQPEMLSAAGALPRSAALRQAAMLSTLKTSQRVERIDDILTAKARQPYRDMIAGMWGTSGKTFDLVWSRVYGNGLETGLEPIAFQSFPVGAFIEEHLQRYRREGRADIPSLGVLDQLIAHTVARAVNVFVANCAQAVDVHWGRRLTNQDFDCFAWAGVTFWHAPDPKHYSAATLGSDFLDRTGGGFDIRYSWPLGNGDTIAQETGITVVSDLRVRNVSAGGQGAPYAPYYDVVILRHPRKRRCVQNLGGIGNVTYLEENATFENALGFDTGPANMPIDEGMRRMTGKNDAFDRNGEVARSGTVHWPIVEAICSREFFKRRPPKSTGFEPLGFGPGFADWILEHWPGLSWPDYIATVTEVVGESIGRAYRDFLPHPPDEVITCGGGDNNPAEFDAIVRGIHKYCGEQVVVRRYGKYSQWKEPMIMILIANDAMSNQLINLARATGAPPTVCGKWSFAK